MSDWSIESELLRLSGEASLHAAITALGILPHASGTLEVSGDDQWRRAGAESYQYHFEVRGAAGVARCLFKACVAFSVAATDVNEIFDQWILRRRLLQKHRVGTPTLYAAKDGVVLEEFIRWNLWDFLKLYPAELRDILPQLGSLAGVLSRLGFKPIDAFSDLRTRGFDVVAVDFGEDLGPAAIDSVGDNSLLRRLEGFLHDRNIVLDDEMLELVAAAFDRADGPEPTQLKEV